MPIEYRQVVFPPLQDFTATAPAGTVIGIIGEDGAGKSALAHLVSGEALPEQGVVEAPGSVRILRAGDALNFAPVDSLLLVHALGPHDALVRERVAVSLDRLRKSGSTVLLVSHEEDLLLRLSDEVWWLDQGRLAAQGDPATTLDAYRRHIAARVRAWGAAVSVPLGARWRRGDGRAEIVGIETVGETGQPTMVWRSGELAVIRVTVRFVAAVEDPVIGIMVRTRVGLNVYGTNTELEKLRLGPCAAGETLRVTFGFRCQLCPQEYSLTVASHDPDGVWHDWLEDAVAFSVIDDRYTAGVANLRAVASFERG